MIQTNWIRGLALSSALIAGLSGCQQKPATVSTDTTTTGARTDAQIAADVQAKINSDNAVPNKNVTINANNGVITLSGNVGNDAERTAAANDASSVPGVRTVVNNLNTGSAGSTLNPRDRQSVGANTATTRNNTLRRVSPGGTTTTTTTTPNNGGTYNSSGNAPAQVVHLTIPAGTTLTVRTVDSIDTSRNKEGDTFRSTLDAPIFVDDRAAIPAGADVEGRISAQASAGKFEGRSTLALELTRISYSGHTYQISTNQWTKTGASRGKNTAAKVGGGAALGAIIGGIAGGGKGAAIGAGVGAGAGTGVQAVTHGEQIVLSPETQLSFHLANAVTVVPSEGNSNRRRLEPSN